MPRLRNVQSGVVVSTSEETAARLGGGWIDADKPEPKKVPAKKRAAEKPSDD